MKILRSRADSLASAQQQRDPLCSSLGDKVMTDLGDYPAQARMKPKVGGFEPNLEQITRTESRAVELVEDMRQRSHPPRTAHRPRS